MIEKNKILELLKDENYPEFMYENTYQKISRFHDTVAASFASWIEHGKNPDITVEGYSYDFLTKRMNMQPVGAFITLDWLIREPERAKNALKKGIK